MTTVSSDADNDSSGRISQLEKQLKAQLKEKRAFHPDVRNLRGKLREKYVEIILTEPELAERYDTATSLWHLVYYVMIEEFRNRIRYAASAPGVKDANQRVQRLLNEFRNFIGDATKFYSGLILKLKKKYGLRLDEGSEFHSQPEVKQLTEFKRICHRFYIQLGDLARYKEAHSDASKDWSISSGYYFKAMALWPAAGHPHNQLAVVATYMQNDFLAVYHYFRSLGVEDPFITARGNLVLLFEKNRQQYSEIAEQRRPQKKGKEPPKQEVKESEQDTKHNFFVRFVRLQGILFTKTSLETFSDVYLEMVRDLERLLSTTGPGLESVFASELRRAEDSSKGLALGVLQLISILIFSVPSGSSRTSYADALQHTTISNYALTAAFRVAGCFMASCAREEDAAESPLLPASLVFIEWLASRQDLASGGSGDDEKQAKARKGFWRDCLALLNKICDESDDDEASNSTAAPKPALWEDYELAGFTPLSPVHLGLSFDQRRSSSESDSRMIRLIAAGKAVACGAGFVFDEAARRFFVAGEKRPKSLPKSPASEPADPPAPKLPPVIPPSAAARSPVVASAAVEEEEEEVIVFKPVAKAPGSKPKPPEDTTTIIATTTTAIKENGAGSGVYTPSCTTTSELYNSVPSITNQELYNLLGGMKPSTPAQKPVSELSELSEIYGSQNLSAYGSLRLPTPSSLYDYGSAASNNNFSYSSMGLPVDVELNRGFGSLGLSEPGYNTTPHLPGFYGGSQAPGLAASNGHLNSLSRGTSLGGLQETGFTSAQDLLLKLQSSLATARELQRVAPVASPQMPLAGNEVKGKMSSMRPPPGFGPIPQRAQKLQASVPLVDKEVTTTTTSMTNNINVNNWTEGFHGGRAAGQPLYGASSGIWSNNNGGVPAARSLSSSSAYPFPGMGMHTLQQIEQQMPAGVEDSAPVIQSFYGAWKGEPSSTTTSSTSGLGFEQSQQQQQPAFRPYRPQDPFVS